MRLHSLIPAIFLLSAGLHAQQSDLERGIALFEKGDTASAIPLLARAAAERPEEAMRWKALGTAYAASGQYPLAEPALQRACELDRQLRDACYYYGRVLYALDRYDVSIEVLQRARELDRESWQIALGIAQALEALGSGSAAEKEYRQTIGLVHGRDAQPGSAFGQFLVRQGRADEAIALLEGQVQQYPNAAEARIHLGRALLEAGRAPEALAHLEKAVGMAPASAQAHLLLAKCYVRVGRAAEAQAHFDAAARQEPATAK